MIKYKQDSLDLLLERNRSRPLALDAEAALSDDHFFKLPVSQGIPVEAVRKIYKVRAEINKDKHCDVQGYDELIDALDTTSDFLVTVHSYVTHEAKFDIFSGTASKSLIGILKIPIGFQDYLAYTKLATR